MKSIKCLCLIVIILSLGLVLPGQCAWPGFGGDAGHTGFAPQAPTLPYSTLWKFYSRDEANTTTPAVANGRVYCVSRNWLFCLNQDTGARLWEYNAQVPVRSSPLLAGDLVILCDTAGIIHAFRAADGEAVWARQLPGAVLSSPLYYQDKIIVGLASYEVRALAPADGATLWSFKTDGPMNLAPAGGDNLIFALESSGNIYALEASGGRLVWKANSDLPLTVPPVVANQMLYVASGDFLYAMSLRGGIVWRVKGDQPFRSAPAVAGDMLYVTGGEGWLYAITARSGGIRWAYQHSDFSLSTSPAVAGDLIFAGGTRGGVVALDRATGELVWQCQTRSLNTPENHPGGQTAISQPVAADGSLLVLYNDGNLTCLSPSALDLSGPTISEIAPAGRRLVSGKLPLAIQVRVFDEGSGLNPSSLRIYLDGEEGYLQQDPRNGIYYYILVGHKDATLEDGPHTVRLVAADYRGNVSTTVWRFATDQNLSPEELIPIEKLQPASTPGKPGGSQPRPGTVVRPPQRSTGPMMGRPGVGGRPGLGNLQPPPPQ